MTDGVHSPEESTRSSQIPVQPFDIDTSTHTNQKEARRLRTRHTCNAQHAASRTSEAITLVSKTTHNTYIVPRTRTYAQTHTHSYIIHAYMHTYIHICTHTHTYAQRLAGIPPEAIVAAHGNFDSAHCIETGEEVPIEEVRQAIFDSDDGWKLLRDK